MRTYQHTTEIYQDEVAPRFDKYNSDAISFEYLGTNRNEGAVVQAKALVHYNHSTHYYRATMSDGSKVEFTGDQVEFYDFNKDTIMNIKVNPNDYPLEDTYMGNGVIIEFSPI